VLFINKVDVVLRLVEEVYFSKYYKAIRQSMEYLLKPKTVGYNEFLYIFYYMIIFVRKHKYKEPSARARLDLWINLA